MIDEFFEQKVDELCVRVPQALRPHMIRLCNSAAGWRIYLYIGSAFRHISGLLGHIKSEKDMETFMKETAERGDDSVARLLRWLEGKGRAWARLDTFGERILFAGMLFLVALSALGVAATRQRDVAACALMLCVMWLSVAMRTDYAPVCGGIRQRFVAAAILRPLALSLMLISFFPRYAAQGLPTNVVLQSAMIVTLAIHLSLFLFLIAFNHRQPLFLRVLCGVTGMGPALSAAASFAVAASMLGLPWPLPAAGVMSAVGALMAFLADEIENITALGGIRLKYRSVWACLPMIAGCFLMLAGAWLAAIH